jgi:hypothetical protein
MTLTKSVRYTAQLRLTSDSVIVAACHQIQSRFRWLRGGSLIVSTNISIRRWYRYLRHQRENADTGLDGYAYSARTVQLVSHIRPDRILYRGSELDLSVYSQANLKGSDHRPGKFPRSFFIRANTDEEDQSLHSSMQMCESSTA